MCESLKIVKMGEIYNDRKSCLNDEITDVHILPETEHLHNVGLQHHPNNNHVKRLHGGTREREKNMHGLKIENTTKTFAVLSNIKNRIVIQLFIISAISYPFFLQL